MRRIWLVAIFVIVGCSAEAGNPPGFESDFTMPVMDYGNTAGSSAPATSTDYTYTPTHTSSGAFDPSTGQPVQGVNVGNVGVDYLVDAGVSTSDLDEECGSIKLEVEFETVMKPGNILVIFDRSQSMYDPWGNVARYEAAGNALIAAISPLQDVLTVGGQFFPSVGTGATDPNQPTCNIADPIDWIPGIGGDCLNPDVLMSGMGSCEVTEITADDQLNFRPATQFISDLPNYWRLPTAEGGGMGMTPLQTGVERADSAIKSNAFEDPLIVIIMTDGVPNCSTDPAAVLSVVSNWTQQSILTYVIGLPGSNEAASFLSQIATTGGSDTFIEPTDPAILEQELTAILTDTVKVGLKDCNISLNQEEDADVDKLHLVVDDGTGLKEVPKMLADRRGGWSVSPDGLTATLFGVICEDAKAGNFDTIEFTFGCSDLPILQ